MRSNYLFKLTNISVLLIAVIFLMNYKGRSVLAIDNVEPSEVKQDDKKEQAQSKSVRCTKCANECLIEPGKTGKCKKYKNVDGKLQPVERTK